MHGLFTKFPLVGQLNDYSVLFTVYCRCFTDREVEITNIRIIGNSFS